MAKSSLVELFALLPDAERGDLLSSLTDTQLEDFYFDWRLWARPEQLAPSGNWTTWLILAGRGFGKTRAGAEWVGQITEACPAARIALVGANFADGRVVMVEGESGLLSIAPPKTRPVWEPSLKKLTWPNGAEARLYSAAEPEGLRGPQHSHGWCDEIGKWANNAGQATACWDNLKMGLRLGAQPQLVATTTPRPVPLVKALIKDPHTRLTKGKTTDNQAHLPEAFLNNMQADYGGSSLGRQELDGELLEELDGALWPRALLEQCRITPAPDVVRSVVAVDPPASASGDACGIIVAAMGQDKKAYILADESVEKASPEKWAKAVARASEKWVADKVIAEANQGGAMVASVLRAADINLPVRLVHASRGKVARAEPVAALYEAGRVYHVGAFPRLEDEMCGLLIGGQYEGSGRSPDRADALVWALTELCLGRNSPPYVRTIN